MRNSSVTVVCWHSNVTNLQRYILDRGPDRPGPPRVSAFDLVQPRPASVPLPLHSEYSSDAARHLVPVQRCRLRPSESEFRPHRSRFMTPPAGSLHVHCMRPCTTAIPMSARSAPAQDRRLRTRSSRGPLLLAPRVRDDVSAAAARSAPIPKSRACALRGRMVTAGLT